MPACLTEIENGLGIETVGFLETGRVRVASMKSCNINRIGFNFKRGPKQLQALYLCLTINFLFGLELMRQAID